MVADADFEAHSRDCSVRLVHAENCATEGNPELLRTIMDKKVLDDPIKADMKKVIQDAKEAFVAEHQAVGAK